MQTVAQRLQAANAVLRQNVSNMQASVMRCCNGAPAPTMYAANGERVGGALPSVKTYNHNTLLVAVQQDFSK